MFPLYQGETHLESLYNMQLNGWLKMAYFYHNLQGILSLHTALPVGVTHLQVTAGACRVLLGAIGAVDILNLLAQGLKGGINLQVTVTHHIGIISTVVTERIRSFLLGCSNEANVESTTGWSRRSRGSGRSRRSLKNDEKTGVKWLSCVYWLKTSK